MESPDAKTMKRNLDAMEQELTCCHCNEVCSPGEMTQWSSKLVCWVVCKTIYNRHGEMNRADVSGKTTRWWDGLPREERNQWHKDRKSVHVPNKKVVYGNAGALHRT